jgi:hypothetical protein
MSTEKVLKEEKGNGVLVDAMHCALFEVKKYDNTQLRSLLREIHKIGNSDTPAKIKKSEAMKHLFELEKSDYNYWSDKYYNVSKAIEVEVLYRVREGVL